MLATVAFAAPVDAQSTATLSGVWRQDDGSTTIRIAPCSTSNTACTTVIAEQLKPGEPSLLGQVVARDFKPRAATVWRSTYVAGGASMGAKTTLIAPGRLAFKVCAMAVMCDTLRFTRTPDTN